jgi:hypothetical protein
MNAMEALGMAMSDGGLRCPYCDEPMTKFGKNVRTGKREPPIDGMGRICLTCAGVSIHLGGKLVFLTPEEWASLRELKNSHADFVEEQIRIAREICPND